MDASSSRRERVLFWGLVAVALLALVALAAVPLSLSLATRTGAPERLTEAMAPGGRYTVLLLQEAPGWARSPSRIQVHVYDATEDDSTEVASFWVNNDGATLGPDACQILWPSGLLQARVVCRGEEQADDDWLIELAPPSALRLGPPGGD